MQSSGTPITNNGRYTAAAIAIICWLALAGQLYVSIVLMAGLGHGVAFSIWRFLGYFTILTNVLVAVMFTCVSTNRWPGGPSASATALTAGGMYILFVMISYHLLLANLYAYEGLHKIVDFTLHYAVPTLSLLWWFFFAPKTPLSFASPLPWLIFPLAYCGYALLRGLFENWYPYPFIDVSQIGLGQSLLNSVFLTFAFLVLGWVFVAIAKLKSTR